MADLFILHIPVKLTKRNTEMTASEEVDIVYNMTNKYNAMKARMAPVKADRHWHSMSDLRSTRSEFELILDDRKAKADLKTPTVKTIKSDGRKQSTTDLTKRESLTDLRIRSDSAVEKTLDNIATLVESAAATTFRLKQLIEIILADSDVENCIWQKTTNNLQWQMTAITIRGQSDYLSSAFKGMGLFALERVSMNMITVNYTSIEEDINQKTSKQNEESRDYRDFMNSIKARITVAEVVNCVKKNAQFTFDFLVLVSIASIIATVGLLENSTVCLVSSMLISPMMGPILAFTFGITIGNKDLVSVGIRNESFCLFFCVFYGFIFGLIMARVNLTGANWGLTQSWPTPEMAVRGLVRSLLTGSIVALASGAGVCLSVLGGNVSTMVGVAISASLLPPTVNAGLLWGHSLMWLIKEPDFNVNSTTPQPLKCVSMSSNNYQFQYSCRPYSEMFILGNLSVSLTIINILCIILSGIVMLRVKEVVPKFTHTTPADYFFKSQIPFIRETLDKQEFGIEDFSQFASMFSEIYDNLSTDQERLEFITKWQEVVRSLENDPVYRTAMRNLPVEFVRMFRAGKFAPRPSEFDSHTSSKVFHGTPWFVPEHMINPTKYLSTASDSPKHFS